MENKLKSFNSWVNESYLSSDKADSYAKSSGIDVKQIPGQDNSEISSGGKVSSDLIDIAKDLEQATGFQVTVTSGNDTFHKDKKSHHNLGNAIDIVFKEANDVESRKKMEQAIINLMVSKKYDKDGKRLGGINEYDNPSSSATGGHFHISLTPDDPSKDGYESNFALSGITSYSQIRELINSGASPSQLTSSSSKYSKTEFKLFFRKLFRRVLAKYDSSIKGYQVYNKNGDELLGKVIKKDNKIYFTDTENKGYDITDTHDGELFQKAFELSKEEVPSGLQAVIDGKLLLRSGSTGEEVKAIQQKLVELGYNIPVDGKFDDSTENAVRDYQMHNKLLVDGIVGPKTSGSLYGMDISKLQNNIEVMSGKIKHKYSGAAAKNIDLLVNEMVKNGVTNPFAQVGILSVVGKESGFIPKDEFSYSNTSASRLRFLFGKRLEKYTDQEIDQLKKDNIAFYDAIYGKAAEPFLGWKTGNDNVGDGYKYRGRGFNGITFKNSYAKLGKTIGKDLVGNPELLDNPQIAAEVAVKQLLSSIKALKIDPNSFTNQDDATYAFVKANAGKEVKGTETLAHAETVEKTFNIDGSALA